MRNKLDKGHAEAIVTHMHVFYLNKNNQNPVLVRFPCFIFQVCVKQCPTATINFRQLSESEFNTHKSNMVCRDDVPMTNMVLSDALRYIEERKCAGTVLQSQPGKLI